MTSLSAVTSFSWILVLLALYLFSTSFFLAKRSIVHTSDCQEGATLLREQLKLTLQEIETLYEHDILEPDTSSTTGTTGSTDTRTPKEGCWMKRSIDSLVIIVVDALRFDFALYNLPKSVGQRLSSLTKQNTDTTLTSARLYQFVADPPTVTMQRLKALTTGGLPTFADLSANFGGGSIEDDSWIRLLDRVDASQRGMLNISHSRQGFVGDDTWMDLYPDSFEEAFPYPSFNTRDLDTVDNGCLEKIPYLLRKLRGLTNSTQDSIEVMVVHFLGVDHVGHTYGPHNKYMAAKLSQMDNALDSILSRVEASSGCHTTLIFGDHGMTEDGNHGGGTKEETHAALFVHASPGCSDRTSATRTNYPGLDDQTDFVQSTFSAIHQIDIVPSISLLLGIPIVSHVEFSGHLVSVSKFISNSCPLAQPYANLGSIVPSLFPGFPSNAHLATALALNAAQVWRYFQEYSRVANNLPDMNKLSDRLSLTVTSYKQALAETADVNADLFVEAATGFKAFLAEALESGQKAWTRFNDFGMISGIALMVVALLLHMSPFLWERDKRQRLLVHTKEDYLALLLGVYQFGLVTFSNSYIYEEEHSALYASCILCVLLAMRITVKSGSLLLGVSVLLLPVAGRIHGLFVNGHGLDPAVRVYGAHTSAAFLTSLAVLVVFRTMLFLSKICDSLIQTGIDSISLCFLAFAWIEKRDPREERNGYGYAKTVYVFLIIGAFHLLLRVSGKSALEVSSRGEHFSTSALHLLGKVSVFIMAVTGPASGPSMVLYLLQIVIISLLSLRTDVSSLVLAVLLKNVTRHTFFATNHGCAFNRLQYSSAFITTEEFDFVLGGISLFSNTFGWEMIGISLAWTLSRSKGRHELWLFYCLFQILELLTSCISVSVLRRHLFVWDIFAPHFLFVAIYSTLLAMWDLSVTLIRVLTGV